MFCFANSNNNNEFIKYNAGFELHFQTDNTHTIKVTMESIFSDDIKNI